ncbi:MAG: ATP-dependent zinc protease [Methylococcales bacterium]|nr:ATP-dependent zinc protease [Methylococcales bacterium]
MHKKNNRGASFSFLLFLIFNLTSNLAYAEPDEQKKKPKILIAGWLESVFLGSLNFKIRAKLDTGAKTSSLHAVDIERFMRDGKEWVSFRTTESEKKNTLTSITVPLIREVKIKRHKQKPQLRPVVEMTFCLNDQIYSTEFSLTNRSRFNYKVLLGRSMLQQGILVDPAITFSLRTNRTVCKRLMETEKEEQSKEASVE